MVFNKRVFFLSSLCCLTAMTAYASKPLVTTQVIVAPQCLLSDFKATYKTLAIKKQFALITIKDQDLEKLAVARDKKKTKPCGGFMNVTEDWNRSLTAKTFNARSFLESYINQEDQSIKPTAPYSIKYEKQVNELLSKLNPQNMWRDLTVLTTFRDRHARSDNGLQAALWLKGQVEQIASAYGRNDVSVRLVETGSYKQPSVVAKMGIGTSPSVVIGGHMDTLSSSYELKPGADDDGTGAVTVLEAARVLMGSKLTFEKPIYFMWYAAEELGLIGSQYVVRDFKSKNIEVDAVMQLDMTGYAYHNDPTMWLISDYVNKDLTGYLETLIKAYVKQPVAYTRCGYACSDHATWFKAGFASCIPHEAKFGQDNPYIHTSEDVMAKLSLVHMTSFAKLSIAFAVELAKPTSSN